MRLFTPLSAGALLSGVVLASPTARHEVHEKRQQRNTGWSKAVKVKHDRVLPMRFALTQSNLDKGHDWLMEVSDPTSEKYGQHWDAAKVAEMFKPSDDAVATVKDWLVNAGIDGKRIKLSSSKSWIEFKATVQEAEELLKTEYHYFRHDSSGIPHIACDGYSLPAHVRKHVDFVTPTVHMDVKIKRGSAPPDVQKRNGRGRGVAFSNEPKLVPLANNITSLVSQLSHCDTLITPDCLRTLYGFLSTSISQPLPPYARAVNPQNSYGIVEYTPQSYSASDLDLFFRNFSTVEIGTRPILDSIDGGFVYNSTNINLVAESNLDLQYAMSLVYPQAVTLYQVGDLPEEDLTSFNNFLDALDASYCAGDDPTEDAVYPDPSNATGSYKGKENCGGFAAAKVISTSYSYNEADLTPAYEIRQCNEYLKLGLLGTTFLYSSGDDGVAGNLGQCIDPVTGNYNNGTSGLFNPSFPGTCPYITSVGATQVIPGTNVVQAVATGVQPEQACETVIYSGGGFSNVFPMPSYQSSAVKNWFATYPPPYTAARFNNSQATRGFPDISANGANYAVALLGGYRYKLFGTSASSPTLGALFTLLNQARLNAGKTPIGFVNPALYANPAALNDVVRGGNQGCGTAGFESAPGWDPVTGLGTPNFPKLLQVFMALP